MNTWDLKTVQVEPRAPQILATSDARAIVVNLPAGESMNDHQVHERAWVTVIEGVISVTACADDQTVRAAAGQLFEFEPGERHAVRALTDSRLLLLLAPWPGDGHPGAMALASKPRATMLAGTL